MNIHDAGPDWLAFRRRAARRVSLPTYAFRHERYWLAPRIGSGVRFRTGGDRSSAAGRGCSALPDRRCVLTGRLSARTHPWLADHVVFGQIVLPGTGLVELALRAAQQVGAAASRN